MLLRCVHFTFSNHPLKDIEHDCTHIISFHSFKCVRVKDFPHLVKTMEVWLPCVSNLNSILLRCVHFTFSTHPLKDIEHAFTHITYFHSFKLVRVKDFPPLVQTMEIWIPCVSILNSILLRCVHFTFSTHPLEDIENACTHIIYFHSFKCISVKDFPPLVQTMEV
jgi:hypothetical protein